MFEVVKIGGVWQIWNVTCDGSIIVENGHRNMGFFERYGGKEVEALINALKAIKPIFSLGNDFSKITLDSDLKQDPDGFHVFDYLQLQEAGIDINIYIQAIDFRLGSFVVFNRKIFTTERLADELDTYPGHQFQIRYLKGQKPAPIEPADTFKVIIPSEDDVKNKLLESARESWNSDYGKCDRQELDEIILQWDDSEGEFPGNFSTFDEYLKNSDLEEQIDNYINIYCYPDLDLKIPFPLPGW
jgi:hypothetical protein